MNRQQSTSISRKHPPENRKNGEREQAECVALLITLHRNAVEDVPGGGLLLPALAGDGDAGRGGGVGGNEEGGRERLVRIDPIAIEIGHALAVEKAVVDEEIAGEALRRLRKD